nr:cytidylate kinase-like family protein [Bacilli bacterium]
MAHRIITIDREFGSGGRELGRRIADILGFAYYDKEIIREIMKKTEFSEEYVRDITEKGPVALFPITYSHSFA